MCVCVRACVRACVCACVRVWACVRACMLAYVTQAQKHTSDLLNTHTHTCARTPTHSHTPPPTHTHTHIHTHTHTRARAPHCWKLIQTRHCISQTFQWELLHQAYRLTSNSLDSNTIINRDSRIRNLSLCFGLLTMKWSGYTENVTRLPPSCKYCTRN